MTTSTATPSLALIAGAALAARALLACATPSSPEAPSALAIPSPRTSPASDADMPVAPAATDSLVGKTAPDFAATAHDGTPVRLGALKGRPVVLYFYPKDETPGCTKEACSFRDAWADIAKTHAILIGISADSTASHDDFAAHYKLPFLLVSDADGAIGAMYGVPFRGHHDRQTFVIGSDGKVVHVYRKVDVTIHASQILDDLTHA